MKSKKIYVVLTIVGFAVLVSALVMIKLFQNESTLPYLCIGLGCGIFGHGLGELISQWSRKKDPVAAKQMDIEQNDERNVAIRNKAQAKAYNIMVFVFGALFMAFGFMGVEVKVVLLLVAAYLFICSCSIYYYMKYNKEM